MARKINVRAQIVRDDSHSGLLDRMVGIMELLLNSGDKIIAVMPSPMPLRETEWTATIFSSFETDR
jgi:hypothetical protein